MALTNGHIDVAIFLLQNGAEADGILAARRAVQQRKRWSRPRWPARSRDRGCSRRSAWPATMKREALAPLIKAALDKLPAEAARRRSRSNPRRCREYAGTYRDAASGVTMTVTLQDERADAAGAGAAAGPAGAVRRRTCFASSR